MKRLLIPAFIFITCATYKAGDLAATPGRNHTLAQVYAICNDARMETNAASEQACADAQDRSRSEFLCQARNNNPSTYCWVESK